MIVDGFRAYDVLLGQPVLIVMSMMLCFLADSPMHAEITNTPVPGASLNPCRMCTLHAPKKADKRSLSYLLQFLEIDSNGSPQPHVERTWEETIEHTYNLYNLFIRKNITAVKAQRIIYGVTDSLNNRFIDGKRKKSSASLKQLILALEEADITDATRFLLSGGVKYNKTNKSTSKCSPRLLALFSNNPSIQKTFGYNAEMSDPAIHYPFQKRSKLNAGDIAAVPMSLSNQFPNDNITQISQLQLNRHEEIRKSYFVLVIFFVTVLNPFYCLDQN
ncbi:hypothetical protein KEM48_007515 [Puccinia striiformis f. sp. tritici PST-130]|nr:hypothetical protein KEM48_007515 [Puccinia striiformis f. sp. tritici PST-130]